MNTDSAVVALSALAHDYRLAVFRLLVEAGEAGMPAGAIAAALRVAPSSLSFHLTQLAQAGLLNQRRNGRSIIYSADYAAMNALMGFLTEKCCGGQPCLPSVACQESVKS